ncbi:MAG: DNA polymerase III subunit gamma/tau [Ilumatobacteraceae bacterium]
MATQSLYRRYRPRRFDELRGQEHIVHALREAVKAGREGQAYLFSGPRGTGKTTTARILAKVLNCTNPADGEPCCECDSCIAVERGNSYDVFELDAASNNSVEDIRNLIDKVSLGTPGRHKVYILDEVHMLSAGASAALLKVLEEPPEHVVFVLATTDPQKLKDTIRSRTQHLQFHLLPSDTLAEHIKWVAQDAGLELNDHIIDAALSKGGGSARDTLSALELLAAGGSDVDDSIDLSEFVRALVDSDTGIALSATAHAVSNGHDPRTLCEELIRHLRDLFLSVMSPELVSVRHDQLDQLASTARDVGTASIVRAMERLGSALVEMRFAPDPRIMLEIALVQLTRDDGADDQSALLARLERLERSVAEGVTTPVRETPRSSATGKAIVGGRARRSDASGSIPRPESAATQPAANPAPDPQPAASPSDATEPAPAQTKPTAQSSQHDAHSVQSVWSDSIRSSLSGMARALFAPASIGEVVATDSGLAVEILLPSEVHAQKCGAHREAVQQQLAQSLGTVVELTLSVERTTPTDASRGASEIVEEPIDPNDIIDAPVTPQRSAEEEIADIFPGTRLIKTSDD